MSEIKSQDWLNGEVSICIDKSGVIVVEDVMIKVDYKKF